MRNVGINNVWALKQLLERKFKQAMAELPAYYNFTCEKPVYELTLKVDAHEFAEVVLEASVSDLKKQLDRANKKIAELEKEKELRSIVEGNEGYSFCSGGLPDNCPKCNCVLIKHDANNAECGACGHVCQYAELDPTFLDEIEKESNRP